MFRRGNYGLNIATVAATSATHVAASSQAGGGWIVNRMYFKDEKLRDFGWQLMYSPSASRWIDSYIAAGAEWHDETEFGVTRRRTDFVLETGLKFRTQVGSSPLRFLSVLTEFWGLRLGVKNYGFFDIDRLTYVVEIGAGSF